MLNRFIPKGKLIAIGGNEDKYTEQEPDFIQLNNPHFFELAILKRIVTECGVENPHIEVITTASGIPEEIGDIYLNAFSTIGCQRVGVLSIRDRQQANNPEYLERVKTADAVMFTGGDQFRLSSILGGTKLIQIVQSRYENEPFVIAGTSAGAMAMSNSMIRGGSSAKALLKGQVKMATGLALIDGVIIDSHFIKRGRFGRMAEAVAGNPACLGIGLGEDTGVLITEGNKMEVIGSGLVIIFDGQEIIHNNISDLPDGAPISVERLIIHVMALGNQYLLNERRFDVGVPMVFTDSDD